MNRISPSSSLVLATVLGLLNFLPLSASAGPPMPLDLPASHWASGDETESEIWLIARSDGAMELHGRDLVSSFGGIVIADENGEAWTCHGNGFRFEGGLSFGYQSTLRLEKKDGATTIVETWKATLPTNKVIEGTTVLKAFEDKAP